MELLMAMAIFILICGAMFGLLQLSQQKYSSESQLSGTFQEARLAIDQIVRDVNDAGYPPLSFFSQVPALPADYAYSPIVWAPGYVAGSGVVTPCLIGTAGGGTCSSPGDFDLIIETTLSGQVNWIRYQLVGTTLFRGFVPKTATDPISATSAAGVMVPFVTNVMNNPDAATLGLITAQNPTMFPGGVPVPVFQYLCETPSGLLACPAAGINNAPGEIRDVDVTLIVATRQRDAQTQRLKLVELNGRGHRLNPSN